MSEDFFLRYEHKVKKLEDLKIILNRKFKNKKIILCHGHFDVVHPGHIRHLSYAKSKADILIVSLTADKYVSKGIYRPHVPEYLRALNIAAFEMVDYVYIDNNLKPLKLLKSIKPDFFAKGFEYTSKGLPQASEEELKLVESYGGKMIFTPGDVVYSSSKFIESSFPKLELEKLILLMKKNRITFDLLKKTLNKFSKFSIHVIGDLIIDIHTKTALIGGQTKTPTVSVLFEKEEKYIGGAGIVAQHLKAAGANVIFTTVLGNDHLKDFVLDQFKKSKIKINVVIDNTRPTTSKNSIINNDYRLLKIDTLDNQPISESIKNKIKKFILSCKKNDAVIFSDFRHGIFNKGSIEFFVKTISKKVIKIADSQVASRWGNITEFKNFDLITPNEREARFSLADQDSSISHLSQKLLEKTKCKNLILKLGNKGLFSVSKNKKDEQSFHISSFANRVVDPVGSGDALLAYSTLGFLASHSLVEASIIGAIAAACECEVDGNIPISFDNIIKKINDIEKNAQYQIK